jgi:hypothetical protein
MVDFIYLLLSLLKTKNLGDFVSSFDHSFNLLLFAFLSHAHSLPQLYSYRSASEIEPNYPLARYGLTKVAKARVDIDSIVKSYKTSLKQVCGGHFFDFQKKKFIHV